MTTAIRTIPSTSEVLKQITVESKSAFQSFVFLYAARCANIEKAKVAEWLVAHEAFNEIVMSKDVPCNDITCLNFIVENLERHFHSQEEREVFYQELIDFLHSACTSCSLRKMFLSSFRKLFRAA
ncbi:MAG: hypothetical protein HWE14_13615 [Flavobacteriia bacterium]|nr:hypothetical protein [Flavobacteriia bacterium]